MMIRISIAGGNQFEIEKVPEKGGGNE